MQPLKSYVLIISLSLFMLAALASCSETTSIEGIEGGACYGNGTCNAGLKCSSNVCLKIANTEPVNTPDGSTQGTPDSGVPKDSGGDTKDQIQGKFSFFVTSLEAMQKLSGSKKGFGGNLGGLTGADKICQTIAEGVGAGHKTWKAFLSVTKGPDGKSVNAIDRIGQGPWYDRNGRLVSQNIQGLLSTRPQAHPQIASDLPNEHGQGQRQFGDNHDVLTGSNAQGKLNSTNPVSTCQDWTSAVGPGSEKKVVAGHSWPSSKSPGWIRAHTVPGCAPGVNLIQNGGGQGTNHVGGAGGYGGIYCFALTP